MRTNSKKGGFEADLLYLICMIGTVFWLFGVAKGIIFAGNSNIIILDLLSACISILGLIGLKRGHDPEALSLVYCVTWLPLFVGYWQMMNGLDGPFSYGFFVLIIVYVALLQPRVRVTMVALLCIINLALLGLNLNWFGVHILPSNNDVINPIALDYFLCSFLIACLVAYMKSKFDSERKSMAEQNQELTELNRQLREKRKRLVLQQEMMVKIQTNLEVIMNDRLQEYTIRNRELADYAYENAHMIRGPLTNILALVDLIKIDGQDSKKKEQVLNSVELNANELDSIIKKLNRTLN